MNSVSNVRVRPRSYALTGMESATREVGIALGVRSCCSRRNPSADRTSKVRRRVWR